MRAFIALELPEKIKTEIENIQQGLIKVGVQARWVKPEMTHLTLAFLGSITPNKIEPIEKILDEVAGQIRPVKLKIYQLGSFPNFSRPRIIFIDLRGELGKLNALAIKVRKQLKKERIWFDEKAFVAHITLGRIKKRQNLTGKVGTVKIKRVEFIADEITLTKSQLTETGPIYTKLKCVSLA